MVSVKKSKIFSSLFLSKITLRAESPSIVSRKDRSDSAGRVIQNRSIVDKYNLLKRNSLRTILFPGADLGGGCRGCAPPPPDMSCGFLIQLVFCQKKKLCGLLVLEQSKRRVHPILKKILDPPLLPK